MVIKMEQFEQSEQIQIPVMEEKPHKNKNWNLIAGIAAGCVAIVAVIVVFVIKVMNIESGLVKGVRNLTQEMNERRQLWEEATGNSLMNELNTVKSTIALNISADEMPVTIALDASMLRDGDAHKLRSQMAFSIQNMELIGAELYGNEDELMVSVPTFWERNLVFEAENIDKQYNNSLFAEKFGRIEEEISIDLFPEETHFAWTELFLEWQEADHDEDSLEGLPEITIEELEGTTEIVIAEREDRQYQCSQYRIFVPQERMEGMMERGMTETSAEAGVPDIEIKTQQDMALIISIDKNDRIVQISFEEPVKVTIKTEGYEMPVTYTGNISFVGEERTIDDILVDMEAEVSLSEVEWNESLFPAFGNGLYVEDETYRFEIGIEVLYDEKDTSIVTNIRELTFSDEQTGEFRITGSMTTEPLRDEIEPLEGESIRIFEITENEYDELVDEMQKKVLHWLLALSQMDVW